MTATNVNSVADRGTIIAETTAIVEKLKTKGGLGSPHDGNDNASMLRNRWVQERGEKEGTVSRYKLHDCTYKTMMRASKSYISSDTYT